MGMLARWNAATAGENWSAFDDRWYVTFPGMDTEAGVVVSHETVLRCGTVLAALRVLGDMVAICPPKVFEAHADGTREATPTHYLQTLLRRPNLWQTGYRWRHGAMVHLGTWGNAYNRIKPGELGPFDQLWPTHPSLINAVDQMADGRLLYEYRPRIGPKTILGPDEVMHFRGISVDGFNGADVTWLMRQAVGIALSAERHVGSFLGKGARPSGILTTDLPVKADVRQRLEASFAEAFAGSENAGKIATLSHGYKLQPWTGDHRSAQLFELQDFQVGALLRAIGVPGVLVGFADKTATYASADAFFEKGGIKHCLLPWIENLEAECEFSLLLKGDAHFLKFSLETLLRANTKDQYDALFKATGRPWQSVNETRRILDMNPDDAPESDEIANPSNMSGGGAPSGPEQTPSPDNPMPTRPRPAPPARDEDEEARARRGAQFAYDAAARAVRRELAALSDVRTVAKFSRDPQGWATWATGFYDKHAGHLAEALHLEAEAAKAYAAEQRDALVSGGLAVVHEATWEERATERLYALAYGG